MTFWRAMPVGVSATVRPKSRCLGLGGVAAGRPRIWVAKSPENGRAACAALAEALGLPASAVAVASGAASRRKKLRAAGDPALVASRLAPP